MSEHDWLAERFEENRPHLRAVAYRMLGSSAEADDAVQEAWLRLSRAGTGGVENLGGWLTTVVARVCAEHAALADAAARGADGRCRTAGNRSRRRRTGPTRSTRRCWPISVGLALLVVLDTLTPGRTARVRAARHVRRAVRGDRPDRGALPVATRQLASRARRRVQEAAAPDARRQPGEISRRREVVAAFLAASREGDFDALLTMLDPDIVLRADTAAAQMGADAEAIGARAVAGHLLRAGQGAAARAHRRRSGRGVDVPRRDLVVARLHVHRRHDHRDQSRSPTRSASPGSR